MTVYATPKQLPVKDLDYGYFAKELAEANYAVGQLQGSQGRLANAMHLIGPLVAREAAVSSKIEGTQSTSSDIYLYDAGGKAAFSDTPVVSNYRSAMTSAIKAVQEGRQLTTHLIKALHEVLLKDVRHSGRIGDFRDGDVWIAEKQGDPIEKALYVPPEALHVASYMDNIVDYIENDESDLNLVKAAIAHYQFEAVHPFEDGNGRIGRLLIPLILFYKGDLDLPIVYSSGYFEARPDDYRAALRDVDKTGNYEPWIKFFLTAIKEQANETLALVERIHKLHSDLKKTYENSKSPYLPRVLDMLFMNPYFTIPMAMKELNINVRMTIVRMIEQLEKDGVITAISQRGPKGTTIYVYDDLFTLLNN